VTTVAIERLADGILVARGLDAIGSWPGTSSPARRPRYNDRREEGIVLQAAFVRTVGAPDRVYVVRSDGSEVGWSFPTYGDGLPHDLVHLVVESAFGLSGAFWGRVDEGADPRIINAEANRRGGPDKYAAFGPDGSILLLAEALAAAPWIAVPAAGELESHVRAAHARFGVEYGAPQGRIDETRAVLAWLGAQWRGLRPKGALNLRFERARPASAFEELHRGALGTALRP
jgi:hypothetical protein